MNDLTVNDLLGPSSRGALTTSLIPHARGVLAAHRAMLPQKDDLCGAFCVAIALRGLGDGSGPWADTSQDAVALAAGSTISELPQPSSLPPTESGRRDYDTPLPLATDAALSGTTPAGMIEAVATLTGGAMVARPVSGPWTADRVSGLLDLATSGAGEMTLLANIATRHLWGGAPRLDELLGYLEDGDLDGPPADWDVGHFVVLLGQVRGARGTLAIVADTYPSLGRAGIHLQPIEKLARALERPETPAGGILAMMPAGDAGGFGPALAGLGLEEGLWDNGTVGTHPAAWPPSISS